MEKTVLLSLSTLCFLAFTLTSHTTIESKAELVLPAPVSTISRVAFLDESKSDSIPSKGTFRIHKKTDDQDISIEMEDGDIKELTIDGKEIQPADFENYGIVIEELFGAMEAPPEMEGFNFMIPSIPVMPMIPDMPYMIEGFEMPEMPEMPEINMEHFFNDNIGWMGNGSNMTIWAGEDMEKMRIFSDSTPDGNTRIIFIKDGDSTVISAQHFGFSGNMPPTSITIDGRMMNEEEMKSWAEAMELNAQSMGMEWQAHADQWHAQQEDWREQSRDHAEWRAEQNEMRLELRHLEPGHQEHLRALEHELSMLDHPQPFVYGFKSPSLSLSDQMVQDGLVEEGEEVEIQLTPGKLKINGEKMPDSIHHKYLRLYEQQQGIELSGNSKVEFTTKSKQRM